MALTYSGIFGIAVTFPDSELTRSDTEIRSTLYLPDCSTLGCSIIVQPLEGSGSKQIVAFSSTDKEHASPEISGVIFDEARQLISYRTGSDLNSPRVVIYTQNELIQTIDESPGDDRQLVLREYLPKAGLLRYHTIPLPVWITFIRSPQLGIIVNVVQTENKTRSLFPHC